MKNTLKNKIEEIIRVRGVLTIQGKSEYILSLFAMVIEEEKPFTVSRIKDYMTGFIDAANQYENNLKERIK